MVCRFGVRYAPSVNEIELKFPTLLLPLTILLVILRLFGVIHWSWLIVLAPIWVPAAIVLVALLYAWSVR